MKKITINGSLLALLFSLNSLADSVDVDINSDTIKGQYNLGDKTTDLGISASAMLTDDKGEVLALTARTQGKLNSQQDFRGGFGGRVYHASPDQGDSFQSLAIGGYLDMTVPKITELTVGVELYYAPGITSTDDVDNFREMNFRATYQLFENAAIYGGLRYLEVEENDFDYEFDDGAHVGFTLQF